MLKEKEARTVKVDRTLSSNVSASSADMNTMPAAAMPSLEGMVAILLCTDSV